MEAGKKLVDLTFLENFTKGDKARMGKYIGMFLQFAPSILDKIEASLKANDLEGVRVNAHSIKPQLTQMGISSAVDLAKNIEHFAGEKINLDQLPVIFAELRQKCEAAFKELETLKSGF